MVGTFQPLTNNTKIVDENGQPTDYFIRWAQTRGFDIEDAVSLEVMQQYVQEEFADRSVIAGDGLGGGGSLGSDVTLNLDASFGDLNNVDMTTTPPADGEVPTWDAGSSLWVPGAGGGSGGSGFFNSHRLVASDGGSSYDVNSTSYVNAFGYWPFSLEIDMDKVTKCRIAGYGQATQSGQTVTMQFVDAGSNKRTVAGDDLVIGNSLTSYDSGWLDVDPAVISAGGLQRFRLMAKGSNSSVDVNFRELQAMFS